MDLASCHLLAPRILRRLPDVWKIFAPLGETSENMNGLYTRGPTRITACSSGVIPQKFIRAKNISKKVAKEMKHFL
jgi:hypothetical protein